MLFLHALFEAVTITVTLDDVTLMRDPIQQRPSELWITKDLGPTRELEIRRENHRTALVAFAAELKQELTALRAERHKAHFIQDDQILFHQQRLQPQQSFFIARLGQFVDEPSGGVKAYALALATGGDA